MTKTKKIIKIFFDLDGTILDNDFADEKGVPALYRLHQLDLTHVEEDVFYSSYKEIMEHYFSRYLANEITFEEQRRIRMIELFSHYQLTINDEEAEQKFKLYLEVFEQNWQCFDDVEQCLLSLKHRELGIITNGNKHQQIQKLHRLGIQHHFKIIIASEEIGIAKPHPEIFNNACRRVDKQTDECIYVGDRLHTDAISSTQAGMRGIWLNRHDKNKSEQVEVIHSLYELSPLLGSP